VCYPSNHAGAGFFVYTDAPSAVDTRQPRDRPGSSRRGKVARLERRRGPDDDAHVVSGAGSMPRTCTRNSVANRARSAGQEQRVNPQPRNRKHPPAFDIFLYTRLRLCRSAADVVARTKKWAQPILVPRFGCTAHASDRDSPTWARHFGRSFESSGGLGSAVFPWIEASSAPPCVARTSHGRARFAARIRLGSPTSTSLLRGSRSHGRARPGAMIGLVLRLSTSVKYRRRRNRGRARPGAMIGFHRQGNAPGVEAG
jgi:hypothetical protein